MDFSPQGVRIDRINADITHGVVFWRPVIPDPVLFLHLVPDVQGIRFKVNVLHQIDAVSLADPCAAMVHNFKCYGIIDRDYRSEYEIEAYKKDNIFTLEVAEVENLFLTEELLQVVNDIMGFSDDSKIENVKKYIIEKRFAEEIDKQICEAIVSEIKYKLTIAAISKKSEEKAKETLAEAIQKISYEKVKTEQEQKFKQILDSKIYYGKRRV